MLSVSKVLGGRKLSLPSRRDLGRSFCTPSQPGSSHKPNLGLKTQYKVVSSAFKETTWQPQRENVPEKNSAPRALPSTIRSNKPPRDAQVTSSEPELQTSGESKMLEISSLDATSSTLFLEEHSDIETLNAGVNRYRRALPALISTSHMEGIIQRIAYHLMFRPVSGKSTGKLPIQLASLAPSHAMNAIAAVVQATLDSHSSKLASSYSSSLGPSISTTTSSSSPTSTAPSVPSSSPASTSTAGLNPSDLPPRTVLIIVPSESYKFQAIESVTGRAQLPSSRHWTILTEDEFWSSLFPGYNNSMTPYIDSTGCILVPREPAAQKFWNATLLPPPEFHAVRTWKTALEQNTEAHNVKTQLQKYGVYSARELLWAILKPQTSFDHAHRLSRIQHAVQALKSSHLTDIMPFNTSIETLGMLATIHGVSAQWKIDPTIPNFLSSYHSDIPQLDMSHAALSQANWLPNTSMALNYLEYSNRKINYISLGNSSINEPAWEEKTLEFIGASIKTREKCVPYDFWSESKANPVMISRAATSDPFLRFNTSSKVDFTRLGTDKIIGAPLDTIISPNAHLELPMESIGDAIPILLSAASHASSTRDTPAIPLRILTEDNMALTSLQSMLEMQGIPTLSQNLFATPAARVVCDLFTILVELSRKGVLDRAKELKDEANRKKQLEYQAQKSGTAKISSKPEPPSRSEEDFKKTITLKFGGQDVVNLASAFHTLLNRVYGFDTSTTRLTESRLMYQHLKFKDPMLSLLLGIATNAKYLRLRPDLVKHQAVVSAPSDVIAQQRQSMESRELNASMELATEDAQLMIGMLSSNVVKFRTKALASEILRVQQQLSLSHKPHATLETPSASDPESPASISTEELSILSESISSLKTEKSSLPAKSSSLSSSSPPKPSHSSHKQGTAKIGPKSRFASTSYSKHHNTKTTTDAKTGPKSASEIQDDLFAGQTNTEAEIGAKHLYQDLSYLIGAIRAMPLSPSEIIDLFIARHVYRAEIAAKQQEVKTANSSHRSKLSPQGQHGYQAPPSSNTTMLSEESILLMRAFAKSLEGIRSDADDASKPKEPSSSDALTEHYISNAQYLQKSLQFAKHAYVEVPTEVYQLATSRALSTVPGRKRPAFTHPIILGLDHYSSGSGDFTITLRLRNDSIYLSPQPHLLPPPAEFISQLSLYGANEELSAHRDSGTPDETGLKVEFEAITARNLFASSMLYSLSASRTSKPPLMTYVALPKDSLTLKAFMQRLAPVLPDLQAPSTHFDSHAVNNPSEENLEIYFKQDERSPTTPNRGSHPSPKMVKAGYQRTLDRLAGKATANSHPVLEFSRHDFLPPVNMLGPSFLCLASFRPRAIGATSLRTFRDCQVQFALRYVWSVQPGNPGSLLAATGVALHEAASKVHAHLQEKLAEALKKIQPVASPQLPTPSPTTSTSSTLTIADVSTVNSENAPGQVVEVSLEGTEAVQDAMIVEAFKKTIMDQGMTEQQAEKIMDEPRYRKQVAKAKVQVKNLWQREKEKQEALGQKHKEKKEKEILVKKKEREEKKKAVKATEQVKKQILQATPEAVPVDQAGLLSTNTTELPSTTSTSPIVVDGQAVVPEIAGLQDTTVPAVTSDGASPTQPSATPPTDIDATAISTPTEPTPPTAALEAGEPLPQPSLEQPQLLAAATTAAVEAIILEQAVVEEVIPEEEIDEDLGKGVEDYSFSEQEFSFILPSGELWQGAWDRVDIDPSTGDVEITEYKVNLKRKDAGLLQLQTYALAYWKIHGVIPSKLVLSSLSDRAEQLEYIPQKLDLVRTENLIIFTVQRMTEGRFAPTDNPVVCRSCPYTNQCPSALTASPLYLPAPPLKPKKSNTVSSDRRGSTNAVSKLKPNNTSKTQTPQGDRTKQQRGKKEENNEEPPKRLHVSPPRPTGSFHISKQSTGDPL